MFLIFSSVSSLLTKDDSSVPDEALALVEGTRRSLRIGLGGRPAPSASRGVETLTPLDRDSIVQQPADLAPPAVKES